ncbi:MAG TPA: orotate phosphoribosyltransferase [Candidatus Cloacimonetes bacterium]|nr:orotate phosphoribosyltransferase [Candidatus Cloacimonadota bacterium]
MKTKDIEQILVETGAFLEGHFQLTSGKHSKYYVEKIKLIQFPEYVEKIGKAFAQKCHHLDFDVVVSPALGAIVLGYEVAKQMDKRFIFTQRKEGIMYIRSGFDLQPYEKVLIIEDITTTGGSVFEVIECVKKRKADIVGIGLVVDRSGGSIEFGYKPFPLLTLKIEAYDPEDCPLCKAGIPIIKPGSSGK